MEQISIFVVGKGIIFFSFPEHSPACSMGFSDQDGKNEIDPLFGPTSYWLRTGVGKV